MTSHILQGMRQALAYAKDPSSVVHRIFSPFDPLGPHQRAWVRALRSGEFQQTKNYLNVITSYEEDTPVGLCCLGVASMVANVPYRDQNSDGCILREFGPADGKSDKDRSFSVAPQMTIDWLGLRDSNGTFATIHYEGTKDCLSGMNDRGMTFDQIADFIEANPEEVFTRRA